MQTPQKATESVAQVAPMGSHEPLKGRDDAVELTAMKHTKTPERPLEEIIQEKEKELLKLPEKKSDMWADADAKKTFGLWETLKFSFPRLWRGGCCAKFTVVFNFLMILASKATNVIGPLLLKEVIDAMTCVPVKASENVKEKTCPTEHETYVLIGVYASFKLLYDLLNNLREIPYAAMAAQAEISIAHDVYDHVQRLSLAFHLSRETGKIIRIVSRGSQSFASILRMLVFNITPLVVEVVLVLIVFATRFSWHFFLMQFCAIILYVVVTYFMTERRAESFKRQTKTDQAYNQKATDSLLNFETVKYFNAEEHEEDRFEKALVEHKASTINVAMGLVFLNISQTIVICTGLGGTLAIANWMISNDRLTVGGFVMFNQYNLQIYMPLSFLGTLWRIIRQAMVDVEQVLNLLEVDEQIKEVENPIEPKVAKGEIEFKNVCFTYDHKLPVEQQTQIIKNVSFKIPSGSSVGIVGMTGSGKSTIMRLLYRFYDIQSGQILIDGQDISQMRLVDLRGFIAIVPQDCVLFNETVLYNIAYGAISNPDIAAKLDDETKTEDLIMDIIPAAKRASIHKFIMEKKMGYWEFVGERGLKLSGGEKQRVAIARALLKKTPIMCFDEATSALDTETERQVQEAINEVSQGSTSLIIAHRLSTVRDCDNIIVLKFGEIVEQGSHDELLAIPDGYYKKLWNKQSEQQEKMKREAEEKAQLKEEHEKALEERMQKKQDN